VCDVCVDDGYFRISCQLLNKGVFIPLWRLLEGSENFCRKIHSTSRALQQGHEVAVLCLLMLPHGLALQGRVGDTARAPDSTRATGHDLKLPVLSD